MTLRIASAAGELVLRPESEADRPFLAELFRASHAPPLLDAGLPESQVEQLVAMQLKAQDATYRTLFPNASFWIIERDGAAIGRFVEDDEDGWVYFVDIAVLPAARRGGVAREVTHARIAAAAARGRGARVKVRIDNHASLALCRQLGFVEHARDDAGVYIELRRARGYGP